MAVDRATVRHPRPTLKIEGGAPPSGINENYLIGGPVCSPEVRGRAQRTVKSVGLHW